MKLKTLDSVNLKGKTVLYRAPYDIEVKKVNGVLEPADDIRIRATITTLKYLLKENCKIVILTYVGRPDGEVVEELRTTPHAKRLSDILNRPVVKAGDCIGPEVDKKISQMQSGDILMLENVRFHSEEMIDDDNFAKELCKGKDLIVFDGFPQAHRMHASTTGIERHLPAIAGLYLQHEVEMLSHLLEKPARPLTIIIGGAKANVFLKAQGRELGSSFVEDVFVDKIKREKKDWVLCAKEIMEKYQNKIICPEDLIASDGQNTKVIGAEKIPAGWMGLDIGPKTIEVFESILQKSKTAFLAGPMGKFEDERFAAGSKAVITAMKKVQGETILAGGDTIIMTRRYGKLEDYTHVSLAAGATLEFLAGKELPALKALTVSEN